MRLLNGTSFIALVFTVFTLPFVARAQEPPGQNQDKNQNRVNLVGGLSASEVKKGNTVRFWVTIDNGSDYELDGPVVKLDADDTKFVCSPDPSACVKPPETIQKGQSVTLRGEIRCLSSSEPSNISADVSFTSQKVTSERAVTLGPLVGHSGFQILFEEYKELALPVGLALLGAFLAYWQWRVDKRRAIVSETWTTMLPTTHKLIMKSYLPVLGPLKRGLRELKEQIDKAPKESASKIQCPATFDVAPKEFQSIFFHLMSFWWRFDQAIQKEGALYLKNRKGEDIISGAFVQFRVGYEGEAPTNYDVRARVKTLHKEFRKGLDFPEFQRLVAGASLFWPNGPRLKQGCDSAWKDFAAWCNDDARRSKGVNMLQVFLDLMHFEANRPYDNWYGHRSRLGLRWNDIKTIYSLADGWAGRLSYMGYVCRNRMWI